MHVPERDTMLMTHLSILDAGEPQPGLWHRVRQGLARFFGLDGHDIPATGESDKTPPALNASFPAEPGLRLVTIEPQIIRPSEGFRWRRHPLLLAQPAPDLCDNQREARHGPKPSRPLNVTTVYSFRRAANATSRRA